jgi:uncharacterized protein (DUF305 family)
MPGMMSDADLEKLETVKGADSGAKAPAGKIIDAQQAEITELRSLLTRI